MKVRYITISLLSLMMLSCLGSDPSQNMDESEKPDSKIQLSKYFFAGFTLTSAFALYAFSKSTKEQLFPSVNLPSINPESEPGKLIWSVLGLDPGKLSIDPNIPSTSPGAAGMYQIYISEGLLSQLSSKSDQIRYSVLGLLAHEMQHLQNGHDLKHRLLSLTTTLVSTYVVLNYGKKYCGKIESGVNEVLERIENRSKTLGFLAEQLACLASVLLGMAIPIFSMKILPGCTMGKLFEWNADYIEHKDPTILYKLLSGFKRFLEGHNNDAITHGSIIQRILSGHPSTKARVAALQKRIDVLKAQYNFPD